MRSANVWSQIKHMSNYHAFEAVGRGSETQLQMGDNLNYLFSTLVDTNLIIFNGR